MVAPVFAILGAAAGFQQAARTGRQRAFNTALTSFTHDPGASGPPVPGAASGSMLTPVEAAGFEQLFKSNPAQAMQMLNQHLTRKHQNVQNLRTHGLQLENLDLARDEFALAEDAQELRERQFASANDPAAIRARAMAGDPTKVWVRDPLAGGAWAQTEAPGTKPWRDLQRDAVLNANGANVINELLKDVAINGVAKVQGDPGFGTQDGLRTRAIGAIKQGLQLGALDEGVLVFAGKLTGDALSVEDFILANDATTIERLLQTQQMFIDAQTTSVEDIRLLQGVNPAIRQLVEGIQQNSVQLQQFVQQRLGQVQQVGGMVADLQRGGPEQIGTPGALQTGLAGQLMDSLGLLGPSQTFLGNEARGGPVELVRGGAPRTGLQTAREGGNVAVSNFDRILNEIFSFAAGAFVRGR